MGVPSRRRRALDPRRAARRELGLALWELARGAAALPDFWITREGLRERIAEDLRQPAPPPVEPPAPDLPRDRPLRLFLSCAEASGEIHGANLARALLAEAAAAGAPAPELVGFGGARLEATGVRTLADPGARATMDAGGALGQLPFYVDLLERAGTHARDAAPDLFVPVDSPALHVPMASLVRGYGVPVVHHITPQYWAWAPWRVGRYRRVVDLALTILPFEPAWFARHGVAHAHVGHPILDAHAQLPPAPDPDDPGRRGLVLLPGSRSREVRDNLPWMLATVRRAGEALRDAPLVVVQQDDDHAADIRALLEAHAREHPDAPTPVLEVGDLHGSLGRARAALAVSGTILTDLLRHRLPTTVVYRVTARWKRALRGLLTTPHFAGVNLVAGEDVLPEFGVVGEGDPGPVAEALARCYNDEPTRRLQRRGLERAARRLGPPGAARRAARLVLARAAERARLAAPSPRP